MATKDGRRSRPFKRDDLSAESPADMQVTKFAVRLPGIGVKGETTHRRSMDVLAYALLILISAGAAFAANLILGSYSVVTWVALSIVAVVAVVTFWLGWLATWGRSRAAKKQGEAGKK